MPAKATSVQEILTSLPEDRRAALEALRTVIRKNIDKDFEEGIQYGMIAYYLPHSKYPAGYHCDPKQPLPFASIASQKNHIGLYLFCVYCDAKEQETFVKEWKASGKKLDMGKSCVRAKSLEDIPLDVVGRVFKRVTAKRFVAAYEANLGTGVWGKSTAGKSSPKKAATKKKSAAAKAPSKNIAAKKAAAKKSAKGRAAASGSAKKKVVKKASKKRASKKS